MKMITNEDILENLAEGVIGVAPDMVVRVFNQSAENLFEVSRSSVVGRPLSEAFPGEKRLLEMLGETLTEGRLFAEYEEKLRRRFSGPLPVGITTSQVFDPEGEVSGAVALVRDLSGIKSLETGSLRKARLAYIGTFAASLAHELKNPLGGIRGAAQLLAKRVDEGDELARYSGVIIREADRLNTIVDDMLSFARPAELRSRALNIHMILDSVVTLMEESRDGKGKAGIRKEYDPSLPDVYGDEDQLTQVFLNLVKNAREAVADDGRITVVTRVATDFHLIAAGGAPGAGNRGMMITVEVRDNGSGIAPETLEDIFTPFYTTKPGGSGLGMAITLKIVKEHGGLLRIDSEPDEGTTVAVHLPVAGGKRGGE